MTTTDSIEGLLKDGVVSLTIGTTPKGARFVQAQHAVQNGEGGNCQQIMHQAEGHLPDCINMIRELVDHANEKRTMITLPRGARG